MKLVQVVKIATWSLLVRFNQLLDMRTHCEDSLGQASYQLLSGYSRVNGSRMVE